MKFIIEKKPWYIIYPKHIQKDFFSTLLVGVKWKGNRFTSPIRGDNNPDCFLWEDINKVYMYDPVTNKNYEVFELAKLIYNKEFKDCLKLLKNSTNPTNSKFLKIKENTSSDIKVSYKFTNNGNIYWNNLGLENKYEIEYYTFNGELFYPYKTTYAYKYNDKFKLYCPNSNKKFFLSNINQTDTIHYTSQSQNAKHVLVICKSYKDQLVCQSLLPIYDYCHIQGEGMTPYWDFLKDYENIILFYDNDEAGIEGSKKMCKFLYEKLSNQRLFIEEVFIPKGLKNGIKDISDFYLQYGRCKSFNLLINLFNY